MPPPGRLSNERSPKACYQSIKPSTPYTGQGEGGVGGEGRLLHKGEKRPLLKGCWGEGVGGGDGR